MSDSNNNKNSRSNSQQKTNKTSKLTHQGQFSYKSTFLCRFCGGKTCSKEDYKKNPHENAILGLHSDWITDEVLATQRLSTRIIREHNIISQLKQNQIKAVFNLQEPGEHPYCGDGLEEKSGFTYLPEELIKNGIYFFNFNWVDMTVTDERMTMRLMNFMDFIANQQGGKFLVHCHAGTGRTGLACASWLIYGRGFTAEQAIKQFQQRRKGGLVVRENKKCFSLQKPLSIEQIVENQKKVTLNCYQTNNYVPLLVQAVFSNLQQALEQNQINIYQIINCFTSPGNREQFSTPWDYYCENQTIKAKQLIDSGKWEQFKDLELRVQAQVILDFFEGLNEQSIDQNSIKSIMQSYEKCNKEFCQVFQNKEILKHINIYQFSLLNAIVQFITAIQVVQKNVDTKIIQDDIQEYKLNFYKRLAVSIYRMHDVKQKCIKDERKFQFELLDNIDQQQVIVQFSDIIDNMNQQALDDQKELNLKLIEKQYLRAHHILETNQELQKKQKKDQTIKDQENDIPDDLSQLIIGKYNNNENNFNSNAQSKKSQFSGFYAPSQQQQNNNSAQKNLIIGVNPSNNNFYNGNNIQSNYSSTSRMTNQQNNISMDKQQQQKEDVKDNNNEQQQENKSQNVDSKEINLGEQQVQE